MIAEIIKVGKTVKAIPKKLVLFIIKCYQVTISPDHSLFLKKPGGYCRYFPSCSQYCYEAVDRRGGHKPLIEFRARQSCIRQAMAKPLPGAAGDAFLKGAVSVGHFTIYEVMPISSAMRVLILENASMSALEDLAVKEGMLTLRMGALNKLEQGVTTIE